MDLLLVIDMQNVYRPGEEWGCPRMAEITENIKSLLEAGVPAVFTRFVPPREPLGTWRDYNRDYAHINASAYLNDMVEELKPYLTSHPVVEKSTYSSWTEEVADLARDYDRVLITGVVADCCVLSTLMAVIDSGKKAIYLPDCVAGQVPQHEAAVRMIAEIYVPMHTLVMDSEEYLASK